MTKRNREASVQEAANHLGVTSRSILNYIREKEIEAIKVGKTWFSKLESQGTSAPPQAPLRRIHFFLESRPSLVGS